MYLKDFDRWNRLKQKVQEVKKPVHIRAGEIRWVIFGVNIGSEIDGKGLSFTRPALIIHSIGSQLALVAPFATKLKNIPGYIEFVFKNTITSLCIHQIRIVSQKRILARKGKISTSKLLKIKEKIINFYSLALTP